MKRTRNLLISLFLLSAACRRHPDPSLAQMTGIIKSLDHSNDFIYGQINNLERILQNRSDEPYTTERTKIWLPHFHAVKESSDEMHTYLNSLRSALRKQAHLVLDSTNASSQWGDKSAVYDLFEKAGGKKELSGKIAAYHKAILNAWNSDSMDIPDVIKEDIKKDIPRMITHVPESLVDGFDPANTTAATAYILLAQIENDMLLTQFEMARYADIHTNIARDAYDKYSFLAGVNSNYLKAGQTLTIDAGIGAFSLACKPKVTINGVPIEVNTEGVAEYSTVVGNTPGKHTIPIRIEYTRPDGSTSSFKKDIKYEIAP